MLVRDTINYMPDEEALSLFGIALCFCRTLRAAQPAPHHQTPTTAVATPSALAQPAPHHQTPTTAAAWAQLLLILLYQL